MKSPSGTVDFPSERPPSRLPPIFLEFPLFPEEPRFIGTTPLFGLVGVGLFGLVDFSPLWGVRLTVIMFAYVGPFGFAFLSFVPFFFYFWDDKLLILYQQVRSPIFFFFQFCNSLPKAVPVRIHVLTPVRSPFPLVQRAV